jgi:alpha-glucan,water dikinase
VARVLVLACLRAPQILPLLEACVEARTELALSGSLTGNREMLYLDLALEDQARQAAERGVGSAGESGSEEGRLGAS